jgi:hypothetical protein
MSWSSTDLPAPSLLLFSDEQLRLIPDLERRGRRKKRGM